MNNGKNRTMYTDISYLFEDSKERLWVGTWGAGLYLITNRDTIGSVIIPRSDGLSVQPDI